MKEPFRIDRDLGDVAISAPGGEEIHVFSSALGLPFDDDGEIAESVRAWLESELGEIHDVRERSHHETLSYGEYSAWSKKYLADSYELEVINDEVYVGAAGGTEQIILAIVSGAVGGSVGALMSMIVERAKKEAAGSHDHWTDDKRLEKLQTLLTKRFGAQPPVTFERIRRHQDRTSYVATDADGKRFRVLVGGDEAILTVELKQLPTDS